MNLKKIEEFIVTKSYLILMCFFCVSIIPMIYLGVYDYPQSDDFCFSSYTHNAWISTHSLVEVIKQAFSTSVMYWHDWAGTFSSVFFFSLQPEAFVTRGYAIVPLLFIGLLSVSIWLLVNTIMIRVLKIEIFASRTIASFIMIYAVWFIPDACQAFYWYNSATHYILSFSMMLINTSLIVIGSNSKKKVFLPIIASITSVIVGGGNFISALLMAIIYFMFAIIFVLKNKRNMIAWIIPAMFFYLSFIINVIAPGNAERQGYIGVEHDNPISTIMHSFEYAFESCFFDWMNVFVILFILMLIPFIWRGIENNGFNFRYPIIVIIMNFCLLASMFAPVAYAECNSGPGRVKNLIFVFHIICLAIDEVYVIGWVKNKIQRIKFNINIIVYLGVCIVALLISVFVAYKCNNRFCNTITAVRIIKNNEAVEYGRIVAENMDILNTDDTSVKIYKIVEGPVFFYSGEIGEWKSGTKAYFNKELVEYY